MTHEFKYRNDVGLTFAECSLDLTHKSYTEWHLAVSVQTRPQIMFVLNLDVLHESHDRQTRTIQCCTNTPQTHTITHLYQVV